MEWASEPWFGLVPKHRGLDPRGHGATSRGLELEGVWGTRTNELPEMIEMEAALEDVFMVANTHH